MLALLSCDFAHPVAMNLAPTLLCTSAKQSLHSVTVSTIWLSLSSRVWRSFPFLDLLPGAVFAFVLKSLILLGLYHIHLQDFIIGLSNRVYFLSTFSWFSIFFLLLVFLYVGILEYCSLHSCLWYISSEILWKYEVFRLTLWHWMPSTIYWEDVSSSIKLLSLFGEYSMDCIYCIHFEISILFHSLLSAFINILVLSLLAYSTLKSGSASHYISASFSPLLLPPSSSSSISIQSFISSSFSYIVMTVISLAFSRGYFRIHLPISPM